MDTPIYGNPHIISMSEITSSMTTTATRLGTCFSFLPGRLLRQRPGGPCCCCCWAAEAESAAEAASSKFAGRTCGNIWTHTQYIYICGEISWEIVSQFVADGENSWDVYESLTSGNNFLGATECDESGGCLHVTPRWGSWDVSGSLDFGWI